MTNHRKTERGEQQANGLGEVARDAIDHVSIIARDWAKLARLEARRLGEHLRTDVGPRVLLGTAATVCALLAVTLGLIALFLGIAWLIGSVAWTFAIFAALFIVAAVGLFSVLARPAGVSSRAMLPPRFPATEPEKHARVRRNTIEGQQAISAEAPHESTHEEASVSEGPSAERRPALTPSSPGSQVSPRSGMSP